MKKVTKRRGKPRRKATSNVPAIVTKVVPARMTPEGALRAFDMLGITTKLEPQQKLLFIEVAVMNNLNPLKREIHAVERKQKQADGTWKTVLTPVTGYEVFIDRAEESGRLHYWHVESTGTAKAGDLQSTVTIKRKDWPVEFKWTCRWVEVSVENPMWSKEPTHMTEKVAISRAFRLCFRDVLQGMPFTMEEEQSREEPIDVTPLKEPKAVKQVEAQASSEAIDRLLLARAELDRVFKLCGKSKLFSKDEITAMVEAAMEKKDDLAGLQSLLSAWQIKLGERTPKKEGEA